MELPPMKTGFNPVQDNIEESSIGETAILLIVFMQNVMNVACEYTKYSGREVVTPMDMIYSLKYEAFNFCKRGSLKEYIDNCEFEITEGSDDESIEEIEEEDENTKFKEADSNLNKFCRDMNEINEFWDNWTPTDDIEALLKRAVDASMAEHLLNDSNGSQTNQES